MLEIDMTTPDKFQAGIEQVRQWSERENNRVWLNAVADIAERYGYFPLDLHDVARLREIADQLKLEPAGT